MSEITFNYMMHQVLTTKRAASEANPHLINPWTAGFNTAFQRHLDDEALRWLVTRGCQGFTRTGKPCPGPQEADSTILCCLVCQAVEAVKQVDAEEAALRAKWAQSEDQAGT